MDFLKKLALLGFMIALGLFFLWAIFVPKEDIERKINSTLEQQKNKVDVAFKEIILSEVINGKKYWEIKAATSNINKTMGIASMKEIKGTFFENGNVTLKFMAPSASWNMLNKEIYLDSPIGYDTGSEKEVMEIIKKTATQDSASIFNLPEEGKSGYWFKANNLNWKLATQKIVCSNGIILHKGETTIASSNLESDVGLKKVILTGSPKATISEKPEISIEALRFEIDSTQDMIVGIGNTNLKRDKARITCNDARYYQKEKRIVLSQNPIIYYGENKLSGTRITIDLITNKIQVEGAPQNGQGQTQVVFSEEELTRETR